jgi:AcrR family transcriptional regulator
VSNVPDRRAHARGIRERILRTAASGFRERGYRGTTLQHIADDLGYTAPSVYKYFRSKEEIYLELARRIAELHRTRIVAPPLPARHGFAACVEELVARVFRLTRDEPDLARLLIAHYPNAGRDATFPGVRTAFRRIVDTSRKKIDELLRRGRGEGLATRVAASDAVLALEALVLHYSRLWLAEPESFDLEKKVPTVATLFLAGTVEAERGQR